MPLIKTRKEICDYVGEDSAPYFMKLLSDIKYGDVR